MEATLIDEAWIVGLDGIEDDALAEKGAVHHQIGRSATVQRIGGVYPGLTASTDPTCIDESLAIAHPVAIDMVSGMGRGGPAHTDPTLVDNGDPAKHAGAILDAFRRLSGVTDDATAGWIEIIPKWRHERP